MRHKAADNTLIAGYSYGYNRVNFDTHKLNITENNLSEVYELDSTYRVVDFKRGTLNPDQNDVVGTAVNTQNWQLDGVSNWNKTNVDGTEQTQTVNNMNEYDDFAGVSFAHDDNGNMTDDGERLFVYDAMNRVLEVVDKDSNERIALYTYDAMGRRTSKQFERTEEIQGGGSEYTTDSDTVALYHYNETSGKKVIDSSGNNNHGKVPRFAERGIPGLFDTNAIKLKKFPIVVKDSRSFSEIDDELTVETFVYIDSKRWKKCTSGSLVHKFRSFELEIDRKTRKACFTVFTKETKKGKRHKKKCRFEKEKICSDDEIPLDQWVHIAGVYDGEKLNLFVNCEKQVEEKEIDGDVKDNRAPMFIGGQGLTAKLEETRISSTARTAFNCNPNSGDGGQETVLVKRNFFYSGWRVVEEREQTAQQNQNFGTEKVTRQYVDGIGIDEHLTASTYDETGTSIVSTIYYHENKRGDTIAITNEDGETISRYEYTTYGAIFEVTDTAELETPDSTETLVYAFQGRRIDTETGLMYYRHRYYNQNLGRFLQRDPKGYIDSLSLYEAFASNPYMYGDPMGEDLNDVKKTADILKKARDAIKATALADLATPDVTDAAPGPKIAAYAAGIAATSFLYWLFSEEDYEVPYTPPVEEEDKDEEKEKTPYILITFLGSMGQEHTLGLIHYYDESNTLQNHATHLKLTDNGCKMEEVDLLKMFNLIESVRKGTRSGKIVRVYLTKTQALMAHKNAELAESQQEIPYKQSLMSGSSFLVEEGVVNCAQYIRALVKKSGYASIVFFTPLEGSPGGPILLERLKLAGYFDDGELND